MDYAGFNFSLTGILGIKYLYTAVILNDQQQHMPPSPNQNMACTSSSPSRRWSRSSGRKITADTAQKNLGSGDNRKKSNLILKKIYYHQFSKGILP